LTPLKTVNLRVFETLCLNVVHTYDSLNPQQRKYYFRIPHTLWDSVIKLSNDFFTKQASPKSTSGIQDQKSKHIPCTLLAHCLHIPFGFVPRSFRNPKASSKHSRTNLQPNWKETRKACNFFLLEKKKTPLPHCFLQFSGKGALIMVLGISKIKTLKRLLFCELQMYHQVDFFANASSGWIVIDVVIKSINTCRSFHS